MQQFLLFFWIGLIAESVDWPRKLTQEDHVFFLKEKEHIIDEMQHAICQGMEYKCLYQRVCHWRYSVAKACHQKGYSLFGCSREGAKDGLFTNVRVVRGEYLLEKLRFLVSRGELRSSLFRYRFARPLFQVFPIYGEIEGKRYLLTEVVGNLPGVVHKHPELGVYFGDQEGEIIWAHLSHENLPFLQQHVAYLYEEARCASREELSAAVARFHWWFVHSMPCYRGSAAIGEVLVAALWRACGIHAVLREKVMVDLEALSSPDLEEFISRYRDFYASIEVLEG